MRMNEWMTPAPSPTPEQRSLGSFCLRTDSGVPPTAQIQPPIINYLRVQTRPKPENLNSDSTSDDQLLTSADETTPKLENSLALHSQVSGARSPAFLPKTRRAFDHPCEPNSNSKPQLEPNTTPNSSIIKPTATSTNTRGSHLLLRAGTTVEPQMNKIKFQLRLADTYQYVPAFTFTFVSTVIPSTSSRPRPSFYT